MTSPHVDDVICDSVWILEPWDHVDGVRCVKQDVTESLDVNVVNVVYLAP